VLCATLVHVPMTQQKTWRAGRFWWDCNSPAGTEVTELRALVFDLDALADVECDGHRLAYNAAYTDAFERILGAPAGSLRCRKADLIGAADASRLETTP
jgi:hypothetical protein